MFLSLKRLVYLSCLLSVAAASAPAATQPVQATAPSAQPSQAAQGAVVPPVLITVGDQAITVPEYEIALVQTLRQKFYHGKMPEGQLQVVQQEVANQLVDRALLRREAARRGIAADKEKIQETLRGYDTRYRGNPSYEQSRDRMLSSISAELETRDVLAQLEVAVRNVQAPSEAEARAFYDAKRELFTEPEKLKVSLIMIGVDPSAPRATWEKAKEEARAIHARLAKGADFAELARLHSTDKTGQAGGDMGYLHKGMLTPSVQERLEKAVIGQVLDPVTLLEGEAIFRLDDKVPAKVRAFEDVKGRAGDLLRREKGEDAWKALLSRLRGETEIRIDQARFAEVAARLKLDR